MQLKRTFIQHIAVFFSITVLLVCILPVNTSKAMVREPKLNFRYLSATRHTTYKLNVYNMQPEYTVTFSSSNTGVVAIRKAKAKSCRLKTKASGNATITADIYDSDDNIITSLKCRVTVSPSAVSIKFNKHKIKLTEGSSKTVRAVIKPNISAEQPLYISDDPDIATVSSTGTVMGISEGRTTIRASISNGKEASYTIIVEPGSNENNEWEDDEEDSTPSPSTYNIKNISSEDDIDEYCIPDSI